MYWWTTIFLGLNLILFIFFYEETKFSPTVLRGTLEYSSSSERHDPDIQRKESVSVAHTTPGRQQSQDGTIYINHDIPLKSYRQRMALVTNTPGTLKDFLRHAYQPFVILFSIPAVAYSAIQYGSILAWFSILATTEATYFVLPPYNFDSVGIGLLNLPPFIGSIFGAVYGGPLSDWSIIWFTKRNKGVFEPEMRLYLAILPSIIGPVGLLIYGYGTASVSSPDHPRLSIS
jgi:hypothetical protein